MPFTQDDEQIIENVRATAPTPFSTDQILAITDPTSMKLVYTAHQAVHPEVSEFLEEFYTSNQWKKIFNLFWLIKTVVRENNTHLSHLSAERSTRHYIYSNGTGTDYYFYTSSHPNTAIYAPNSSSLLTEVVLSQEMTHLLFNIQPRTLNTSYISETIKFIRLMMPQLLGNNNSLGIQVANNTSSHVVIKFKASFANEAIVSCSEHTLPHEHAYTVTRATTNTISFLSGGRLVAAYNDWNTSGSPTGGVRELCCFYTDRTPATNGNMRTAQARSVTIADPITNEEREIQRNWEQEQRAIEDARNAMSYSRHNRREFNSGNVEDYISNAVQTYPDRATFDSEWRYSTAFGGLANLVQKFLAREQNGYNSGRAYDRLSDAVAQLTEDNQRRGFLLRQNGGLQFAVRYKRAILEQTFRVGTQGPTGGREDLRREINDCVASMNRIAATFDATVKTVVITHNEKKVRFFVTSGFPYMYSEFESGLSPVARFRVTTVEDPLPIPEWFTQPIGTLSTFASTLFLSEDVVVPAPIPRETALRDIVPRPMASTGMTSMSPRVTARYSGDEEEEASVPSAQDFGPSIDWDRVQYNSRTQLEGIEGGVPIGQTLTMTGGRTSQQNRYVSAIPLNEGVMVREAPVPRVPGNANFRNLEMERYEAPQYSSEIDELYSQLDEEARLEMIEDFNLDDAVDEMGGISYQPPEETEVPPVPRTTPRVRPVREAIEQERYVSRLLDQIQYVHDAVEAAPVPTVTSEIRQGIQAVNAMVRNNNANIQSSGDITISVMPGGEASVPLAQTVIQPAQEAMRDYRASIENAMQAYVMMQGRR